MVKGMSPKGGQKEINKGAASESGARGGQPPKGRPQTAGVGNERKSDMKGALQGQPTDGLKGAMSELKSQHPFQHDDHGPHHGDMSHVRHKPMKLS